MYIKLGNCRIQERDIKYLKWTSTTHSDNTMDISAVIRFRDGEEIKITNISEEEKQNVDQYWSDEFINIAGGLHKLVIKESCK